VAADMEPTKEGIGEDKVVHSVVYVPNSKDTTAELKDNVSEVHIRSCSPSFRKRRIKEPDIDTALDHLEDMEVVVDNLFDLEKQAFTMVDSQ
jgi:hypothetical protein